ncbi:unnamed protein product [Fraxinus pennsylvanica]|uniref:Uncharacterized protein n=1 Tax=Fraxinus pennsylvanica TaxID=56036 RepID=A0AAD1ZWN8_9LAMI|nr:unnamed protein product [Fraxinus pennsylvanica]
MVNFLCCSEMPAEASKFIEDMAMELDLLDLELENALIQRVVLQLLELSGISQEFLKNEKVWKKTPSWIEERNIVHSFVSGDHHQLDDKFLFSYIRSIDVKVKAPKSVERIIEKRFFADVSCIPIVDDSNSLLDIYCGSDIIDLVKDSAYAQIPLDDLNVHQALQLGQDTRSPYGFFNGQRCQICLRSDRLQKVMERLATPEEGNVEFSENRSKIGAFLDLNEEEIRENSSSSDFLASEITRNDENGSSEDSSSPRSMGWLMQKNEMPYCVKSAVSELKAMGTMDKQSAAD